MRKLRACAAMVRRLHIKVRGLDPPEHQLIRPCTWLKFTLKYHAWFEIRNSKFDIMDRPGESVLAKFRSWRPAEKALPSLIYILSAITKCGPKLVFLGSIGWGPGPHPIGPQKMGFGPHLVMADNIYMRLSRAFSAGRKLLNLASTDSPGRFMISNFEFRISNHAWYFKVNFRHVHGRIS